MAAVFDAGPHDLADRLRAAATEHPEAAAWWNAFEAFLARFGSRGPNEWDTAFDTWETDPNLALVLKALGLEDEADRLVERALTSDNPAARYSGPFHAKVFLFLKWLLPDRALAFIVRLRK